MQQSKTRVVNLDETMFTFRTFRAKGWAHRRDRVKVSDSDRKVQTLALVAAIGEDGGLILIFCEVYVPLKEVNFCIF